MNRRWLLIAALATALALPGCATDSPKQNTGTVIGGVAGGVLGSQVGKGHGKTAATIIGAIAGAAIGGAIGKSMDDVDRMKMAQALENNRTGTPYSWHNPDTDANYTVTPTRTYTTAGGPCREFTTEAVIGGKRETVYGTACRQPDGAWKIVS
jgi:surface antigen